MVSRRSLPAVREMVPMINVFGLTIPQLNNHFFRIYNYPFKVDNPFAPKRHCVYQFTKVKLFIMGYRNARSTFLEDPFNNRGSTHILMSTQCRVTITISTIKPSTSSQQQDKPSPVKGHNEHSLRQYQQTISSFHFEMSK